jgi:ribosomal protein L40E
VGPVPLRGSSEGVRRKLHTDRDHQSDQVGARACVRYECARRGRRTDANRCEVCGELTQGWWAQRDERAPTLATSAGSVASSPDPLRTATSKSALAAGSTVDTKVCPRCAETVKLKATACRFCGRDFDTSRSSLIPASQPPMSTSGVAIAAFITGLLGLWIASIPLGISAQRSIDDQNGRLGGRGLATAGIVLGVIGIIGTIVIVVVLIHAASHPAASCTLVYNNGTCAN